MRDRDPRGYAPVRPYRRSLGARAGALGVALFLLYNLNGREIPSYDSQPTKLLAREIAARGTLTLDTPVKRAPGLARRQAFARSRDGHWRSRVSIVPALPAAAVGRILSGAGVIDLDAPLAPAVLAKLTASALAALTACIVFGLAARLTTPVRAAWVAVGFAAGTGMWSTASQTLWQVETVTLCIAGALLLMPPGRGSASAGRVTAASLLLGLAVATRLQVLPAALALVTSLLVQGGRGRLLKVLPFLLPVVAALALNITWFGHPVGGAVALEGMHQRLHAVDGTLNPYPLWGLLGLLVSPSRGLLVYSPVVVVTALGVVPSLRAGAGDVRFWCLVGAAAQLATYACYSVWWGGHTFGPRYLLDILPLLVPVAATGLGVHRFGTLPRLVGGGLLAWSLAVAGTGAFCYPAERWNVHPGDIDRRHARLWDWSDPQIVRCWRTGPSPQNFALFAQGAWRRD